MMSKRGRRRGSEEEEEVKRRREGSIDGSDELMEVHDKNDGEVVKGGSTVQSGY